MTTVDNPPSVKIMDIELERSHVSTYCSACLAVCYTRRHANRVQQFRNDALSIVLRPGSRKMSKCDDEKAARRKETFTVSRQTIEMSKRDDEKEAL